MASSSTQPGATAKKSILTPIMIFGENKPWFIRLPDGKYLRRDNSSISYFLNGKQMISGTGDKIIRRWDLRELEDKEIEEARKVCENIIYEVMVSRDGQWVVAVGNGSSEDRENISQRGGQCGRL